jgi:benzylsuccinate CoA-transferase BbsF subunit
MAALEQRQKTGRGQNIDISEFEAMCSLMGTSILDYTVNNHIPEPQGSGPEYGESYPYGYYKCRGKDRWCAIAVNTDEQWQKLCIVMGKPELLKYSIPAKRKRNIKQIDRIIGQWTANRTAKKVMHLLQKKGIPCSSVNDARELSADPQLKHRNFFETYLHPALGEIRYTATPVKMSATPPFINKPSPLLGENNRYVFGEILEMDDESITEYIKKGIIR